MIPANNHPEIDRLIHLKKHLGGMTMSKLISCQFNIDTACSSQQKLDTVFKIMYQRTASIGQHMLSNLTRGIVPVSDSSASTPGAVR